MPKDKTSKMLSDLGLVEKLLKDAEAVITTLDLREMPRSIECMRLLSGQIVLAKYTRRMLSTIVKEESKQ